MDWILSYPIIAFIKSLALIKPIGSSDMFNTGTCSILFFFKMFAHSLTDVLGVKIPDVPGGLNKVLTILEGTGVNIDYMYAFMGNGVTKHAYMIFRVEDVQSAQNALVEQGIHMITKEDIEKL